MTCEFRPLVGCSLDVAQLWKYGPIVLCVTLFASLGWLLLA